MSKLILRVLSSCIQMALIVGLTIPASVRAQAQILSPLQDKAKRNEADQKISQIADILNKAKAEYLKKGPVAFANALSKYFSETERAYIIKELGKMPELPQLAVRGPKLDLRFSNEVITLDNYRMTYGAFDLKSKEYRYDFSKDLIANLEMWKTQGKVSRIDFWQHFSDLLIPQAHAAMSTGMVMLLAALCGGLVGYFGASWYNKSQAEKSSHAEERIESRPLAMNPPAPAADPGAPVPAGGGATPGTTPPATAAANGTKPATPQPANASDTATEPPAADKPEAEKKTEQQDSEIYAQFKVTAENIGKLRDNPDVTPLSPSGLKYQSEVFDPVFKFLDAENKKLTGKSDPASVLEKGKQTQAKISQLLRIWSLVGVGNALTADQVTKINEIIISLQDKQKKSAKLKGP